MANILVWNVGNKSLEDLIVRLVKHHKVHLLILIERPTLDAPVLNALQATGRFTKVSSHPRFGVYSRLPATDFTRLHPPIDNERMDFWRVRPRRGIEFLLVAVHGLDRVNAPNDDRRALFFRQVVSKVNWAEGVVSHQRTVVFGDFNANPFEASIGSTDGLHAIRMKSIAGKSHRTVLGTDYEFFYNPMWGCYGGRQESPLGTYYSTAPTCMKYFGT